MGSSVEETSSMSNIIIPQEWSEAANTVASSASSPPVTFVCGPKNSGKTIFSRHLVNVLLQRYERIAYLDTDVGQTEFTPPGCLSLTVIDKITPDLTIPCLKTPVRCYFFGDISPKRDPTMYLKCISALYDYYEKEFNTFDLSGHTALPLVVNTSGWVKGIGFDILVDMLKYISPTHMVKIRISAESKNLPTGGFWLDERDDASATLIEISSARQDSLKRSVLVQKDARLLRDLRIMAYFRQCFPSEIDITTIKELARALAAHPPYEVPVSCVKIKHLHNEVPSSEIFYSLNATIVGLAVSSEDIDHLPCCVGLGIVRSIDTLKKIIYVITPVPHNTLEKVDLILQGFIQIPNCLLQVQGCFSPYMASNVLPVN
ncbi:polynucleotide 5'-hydroxyl-kinase NOL9 [Apium graveolens]|uniref:polynucleotide 5'-hydroxyl-kinase NOL9 n=1 Tax=Apium graveolens TaxID=4045 RepID=UPI003D7A7422